MAQSPNGTLFTGNKSISPWLRLRRGVEDREAAEGSLGYDARHTAFGGKQTERDGAGMWRLIFKAEDWSSSHSSRQARSARKAAAVGGNVPLLGGGSNYVGVHFTAKDM